MPRLVFACLVAASAALASPFQGAESCKSCHAAAYAAWSKTAHARSAETLSPEQRRQALCVACHSPSASASSGVVQSVSCESCHGAGQFYSPEYVMKDPELARAVGLVEIDPKTSCLVCHTDSSPSLTKFDVEKKLATVDHWTAERAKRGGKKAKSLSLNIRTEPGGRGASSARSDEEGGAAELHRPGETKSMRRSSAAGRRERCSGIGAQDAVGMQLAPRGFLAHALAAR